MPMIGFLGRRRATAEAVRLIAIEAATPEEDSTAGGDSWSATLALERSEALRLIGVVRLLLRQPAQAHVGDQRLAAVVGVQVAGDQALGLLHIGDHLGTVEHVTGRVPDDRRQQTWAWFVQDTWKVRPNVTLDIGLRMYKWGPPLAQGGEGSGFIFERFDPAWGLEALA